MIGPLIARYDDVDEARRELLARRTLGEAPLPAPVVAKIRQVFGKDLSADQVVRRIIRDVRAEGDAAIVRYTEAIDGRRIENLVVSPAEIDAAMAKVPADVIAGLEVAAGQIRGFLPQVPQLDGLVGIAGHLTVGQEGADDHRAVGGGPCHRRSLPRQRGCGGARCGQQRP